MVFQAVLKNRNVVKSPLTWILFYVHRYLRYPSVHSFTLPFSLTPPYMLFICFYIAFVPFFGGLAVIDLNLPQTVEVCRKYWWKNLLYFNNFDDSTNVRTATGPQPTSSSVTGTPGTWPVTCRSTLWPRSSSSVSISTISSGPRPSWPPVPAVSV